MKSFKDILSKRYGGFNPNDFKKGVEIELSIEEAERIFGKGVVHSIEDIGSVTIHYYIRKEERKVRLFVKVSGL